MFADPLDATSHIQAQVMEHQINSIRNRGRELNPTGECHNCSEPLEGHKLFCDEDCRDDHSKLLRNK